MRMLHHALKHRKTLKYIGEGLKTPINLSVPLRTNDNSSERVWTPGNEIEHQKESVYTLEHSETFQNCWKPTRKASEHFRKII